MEEFKGKCCGVKLENRNGDGHALIRLILEDDGCWHKQEYKISSFWLPELINVLKHAQLHLQERHEKDPSGFGYLMKHRSI